MKYLKVNDKISVRLDINDLGHNMWCFNESN